MELQTLIDAFMGFGWQGVAAVAAILVLVFVGRKAGMLATGNHARLANIVLSAILFGLSENPDAEKGLQAALASVFSALAFELLKWASGKFGTKG